MNKRNLDEPYERPQKTVRFSENTKKHSLDSDEEDEDVEEENVMEADDIEGEEEGTADDDGEVRTTPFNMRDEMDEGHFDTEGHFIWNNDKSVKDNWLDNIDWERVTVPHKRKQDDHQKEAKSLGDDSDSDSDSDDETGQFNELDYYKKLLQYLNPQETVTMALRRYGGSKKKLSSIERLRRKKAGMICEDPKVAELTELADSILTATGNMNIYEETYEYIQDKIEKIENKDDKEKAPPDLDMYSDEFDAKEKQRLNAPGPSPFVDPEIVWEYKWTQEDEETFGPYTTQQMLTKFQSGEFSSGAFARKIGIDTNFYSINRIDFELYLV